MKDRVDWIDTAKGIGIILVVYGHIAFRPECWNVWLCSFHMPLFFFLSGITYNHEKYSDFKVFIKNKVQTLIIPYLIFALITLLWRFGWDGLYLLKDGTAIDFKYLIKQTIGIFAQIRGTSYGIGVWFIPCIFIAFILLHFIMRFANGSRIKAIITASVFLVLGYLYCTYIDIKLPWSIDAAFVAVFFMTIGCVFRPELLTMTAAGKKSLCLGGGMLLLNIVFTVLNYRILGRSTGMWSNNYGSLVYFVLAAASGIALIIIISGYIKLSPIKAIGSHSIYYYGLHILIVELFNTYASKLPYVNEGGLAAFAAATAVMVITLFILSLGYGLYNRIYCLLFRISDLVFGYLYKFLNRRH